MERPEVKERQQKDKAVEGSGRQWKDSERQYVLPDVNRQH